MIFSCFTRHSFQNVHQPWWTVYNDFYPVATEVTSNLLSLAWKLRLHPIVGSNDPKPDPIYASLRLAFHPKCALSAHKCIAQYRLKFQIIHCQFFFWICPCTSVPYPGTKTVGEIFSFLLLTLSPPSSTASTSSNLSYGRLRRAWQKIFWTCASFLFN